MDARVVFHDELARKSANWPLLAMRVQGATDRGLEVYMPYYWQLACVCACASHKLNSIFHLFAGYGQEA